eukprot:UN09353
MQLYANHFTIFPWILGSSTLQSKWGSSDLKIMLQTDRAISHQICNESTQSDILFAFFNVSLF